MPNIKATLTGYEVDWPDQKVLAKVSQVRSHSDGRLTAYLTYFLGEGKHQEPKFSINFSSTQTRKQLVNMLTEKYSGWEPSFWQTSVDELCREMQSIVDEGEPVISISSEDVLPELKYLIYPLFPLGKPTCVFGNPGAGKSQFAVLMTLIAGLPWHDNPLGLGAPEEPHKFLYLDYEGDSSDVARTLIRVAKGMRLGPCNIDYRRCFLPLAQDVDSIRTHMERIGADAVIIDSVSLAAGGDLNKMELATAYIRALRAFGPEVTTISFAHTSKDRESKSKTIIGSVLFEAGFRSVWELRGTQEDDHQDIAMYHNKANNTKRFDEMGIRISYLENGGILAQKFDAKSVPELLERMSNTQRILAELKGGAQSPAELTESLEVNRNIIDSSCNRLYKKDLIVKLSNSKWALPLDSAPDEPDLGFDA